MRPSLMNQNGSMLVLSVFVIIVLALLGLSLASQLRSASQNVVYDVLGTRALLAAQSGMEHIASTAFPLNSDPVQCDNSSVTSTADFSAVPGLDNCSYVARCNSREVTNSASETSTYFTFTSTGTCRAGEIWASRTIDQDGFVSE